MATFEQHRQSVALQIVEIGVAYEKIQNWTDEELRSELLDDISDTLVDIQRDIQQMVRRVDEVL